MRPFDRPELPASQGDAACAALRGVGVSKILVAGRATDCGQKVHNLSYAVAQAGTTADILVDNLITWGVTHVFGMVGDGINPILDALRRRKARVARTVTASAEAPMPPIR